MQRCLWACKDPLVLRSPALVGEQEDLSCPAFPDAWQCPLAADEAGGTPGTHPDPSKAGNMRTWPACVSRWGGHAFWSRWVLGADFFLGSWQVLLLSLLDSAFVLNMKRFPSCRPRAFSLHFYHPIPSMPIPTHSHTLETWLRSPHPSTSTGSPTYLRKPKPSRGVLGPFLPSLEGLGEGVSTVPPKGQLSDPGCWPVHSTAGM